MDQARLIQEAKHGDMRAFYMLVEQYQKPIYGYAYRLTGCHEDAEDLSQEVFVKAFNNLKNIREPQHFKAWLYRVTKHTWINEGRKKGMKIKKHQQSIETFEGGFPLKSDNNPESETDQSLIQWHIKNALNCLSPKERAVFTLKHFQDLKIQEVADTLKLSTGTVKSLLFRSVKKLQKELSGIYKEWLEGGMS